MSSKTLSSQNPPDAVLRVWRKREQIENEAADLFCRLGKDLTQVWGESDEVAQLSLRAGRDEHRHSDLCCRILEMSESPVALAAPNLGQALGPAELATRERAIYAAVAMGCVTETLSTALLIEMSRAAEPKLIQDTIHEILEDEVAHGRVGWAVLARARSEGDVRWLRPYVPGMIREAIGGEVGPLVATQDHSSWGVLPRARAVSLMEETVKKVILPGFQAMGILS